MKISQIKKDTTTVEYSVVVPAKIISKSVEGSFSKYAKDANIPGFRKGKVPKAILQKRFGENALGDAVNQQIQVSVEKSVKDDNLRVAMQPNVEIETAEEGKDLEFTVSYVLIPEIKLMDMSKFKLETIKAKVFDKEVKEAIDTIAKDFRDSEAVSRAAKNGDVAIIDYLGKVDGVAFEGGAVTDHNLELGSNSFIPGFEEQLVGTKAGDKKYVKVTFPTEYHSADLAGKEAVFECTVKEVKEYIDSKIDDAFAVKLGLKDLVDLKQNVTDSLSSQFDGQTRHLVKKDIMDQLDKGHKFDAPAQMVEQEFEKLWKKVQSAKEAGQLEDGDKNKSDKDLEKEYRELSSRRVRLGLLLTEFSAEFKVEVSQDDVNRAVMQESQRYPGQEMQVFEYYQKNPQILDQLRAPILEEKVIDAIIEKADVKTKELNAEEIVKLLEGEGENPAKKKAPAKKKSEEKA